MYEWPMKTILAQPSVAFVYPLPPPSNALRLPSFRVQPSISSAHLESFLRKKAIWCLKGDLVQEKEERGFAFFLSDFFFFLAPLGLWSRTLFGRNFFCSYSPSTFFFFWFNLSFSRLLSLFNCPQKRISGSVSLNRRKGICKLHYPFPPPLLPPQGGDGKEREERAEMDWRGLLNSRPQKEKRLNWNKKATFCRNK